jgi:SWI/SNF-related matrix-associated actin-dependent regulator of chromatin subfamily A-like protein 1
MARAQDFNFSPKTMPFQHQVEAIDYIQKRESVALFDEQGLGKTKIVLDAVCNNMKEGILDGGLIICRKNLIQNWKEEIETHSYLKSIILRGSPKEKGLKFMGFSHFYLINYESVVGEIERLKMFLSIRKMAIILDESHAIKNPKSKSAIAVLQLADLAKKRIIVSGTPVANKPEDLWNQYYFLDKGKLLGSDYNTFKSKFSVSLKDSKNFVDNSIFNELKQLVVSNSIRRLKNDVLELPEKQFIEEYVTLSPIQHKMYEQVRDELYLEIKDLDGEVIIDKTEELLKKLLRLAQIASNPKLIDQSYDEIPAKFPLLHNLVEEIIRKGEKVIVWSSFVDNIRKLKKDFNHLGSEMLFGEIPIEKRNKIVQKFKTNAECKVLIANPAAAREGLTLTVANNAIYLDRNFNLVDYLQSQDRIHRISQTKSCKIVKIIAKNTIDQYIDEILKRKQYLANYIQGDAAQVNFSEQLTKEELLTYLGNNVKIEK